MSVADLERMIDGGGKRLEEVIHSGLHELETEIAGGAELAAVVVDRASINGHVVSVAAGATLVAACCIVSLRTLRGHAKHFVSPLLQTCCVRILLLAPLCGLLAFLSLLIGGNVGVLLDMCRASYEGFCIYSFLALLLVYVGGPTRCASLLSAADCQYPGLNFSLFPLCKVRSRRTAPPPPYTTSCYVTPSNEAPLALWHKYTD